MPDSFDRNDPVPGPYAEAVARLSAIRQALACVEQTAGNPPSETMVEAKLAAGWPVASPARQRSFNARSARTAAGAAAGLEAIADQDAHPAAVERLKRELTCGVESIDQLFSL
ncbi:MAG: hypothetical protein H0W65_04100 [Sphingomonas sp.]|uniref:hypothetical protein n=1 Tax=Sphingomonas sp. TaxID=28214 RepID=UPI0017AD12E2|nr:hypothetical protein [Sphingomonas sp.]MBA3666888.1 hypothetical protein [Sphingomonas sp.]